MFRTSLTRAGLQLTAASFVTLVQELALIRWMPGQVRVLAYFPNVVLISAFLGLGVGCLLGSRRMPAWTWPASLLLLAGVTASFSRIAFTQESTSEHLWLLYHDLPKGSMVVNGIRSPIVTLFVLCAMTFIPLGHFIASRLRDFQAGGKPLTGYALDLLGSLIGVVAFAIVSFLGTFPIVWFAIVLAAGLLMMRPRLLPLVPYFVLGAATLVVVVKSERAQIYSPYYALSTRVTGPIVAVLTNGSLHQIALPIRLGQRAPNAQVKLAQTGYHLPYAHLRRVPRRVLILGAGTGNDVAVALDHGVERVDAVEIDPRILDIGRRLHPSRPYADPRVRTFATDARAFLNDTNERYDLVVFGTLDSMTRLSALSNVRLDNFVYTVECLEAVKRHLNPDGGVAMYFEVAAPYIGEHITAMLGTAFGEPPRVLSKSYGMFNAIFLAGPAYRDYPAPLANLPEQLLDVPRDDWPYLYLASRSVNSFYLSLIAILLGVSIVAVFAASADMRRSLATGAVDLEMFLFGAAFLIVETKLVTEMNLVWGATWLTSAVVFGSILAMILFGTLLARRSPIPWNVAAPALVVVLAATYFIPRELLIGRAIPIRLLLSVLFIGLPVLFASLCFALLFKEREHADVAFGWNMLGAVAGGLLEFSSMAVGLKAMTLVAVTAYLLAILLRSKSAQRRAAPSAP